MTPDSEEKNRKRSCEDVKQEAIKEEIQQDYDSSPRSPSPKRSCDIKKETVEIPENVVDLVSDRDGETIYGISRKSTCHVHIDGKINENGTQTVHIEGFEKNVEIAKNIVDVIIRQANSQITRIDRNTQQPITIEMPVPKNMCGLIIGKNGAVIRVLRAMTNCQMTIIDDASSTADPNMKYLRIIGFPENVEKAKTLVADILETYKPEPPTSSPIPGIDDMSIVQMDIMVPCYAIGAILGYQESNMKRIVRENRVRIQFVGHPDPTMTERRMAVIGTRYRCEVTVKLLQTIIETVKKEREMTTVHMNISSWKSGLIIGRNGMTIKGIRKESGALLEIAHQKPNNLEKTIVIRGTGVQVEHAKHLIRIVCGDIPSSTPFVPSSITFNPYENYQQKVAQQESILNKATMALAIAPPPPPPEDYATQWLMYFQSIGDQAGIELVKEKIRERDLEKAKKKAITEIREFGNFF